MNLNNLYHPCSERYSVVVRTRVLDSILDFEVGYSEFS